MGLVQRIHQERKKQGPGGRGERERGFEKRGANLGSCSRLNGLSYGMPTIGTGLAEEKEVDPIST